MDSSRRHGGMLTENDLADFPAEWVEPISTTYRGWTVYELPPNGQGIAALEMLNIMETFPRKYGPTPPSTLHVMIEAKKLAYADLLRYIGDPRFSQAAGGAVALQGFRRAHAPSRSIPIRPIATSAQARYEAAATRST